MVSCFLSGAYHFVYLYKFVVFFVQVTKWTDSLNALYAVYFNLNIWNGLENG